MFLFQKEVCGYSFWNPASSQLEVPPMWPGISLMFSCRGFLRPLRIIDVRGFGSRTSAQQNLIFLRSERRDESFWAGTSAWTSARTSAGYPAPKLYVWVSLGIPGKIWSNSELRNPEMLSELCLGKTQNM